MEQFRPHEEPSGRLSPEEVEAIARKHVEIEEAARLERERLESLPTVEDVAQALDISPEEVERLAREIRSQPPTTPVETNLPNRSKRWALFAASIVTLILGGVLMSSVPRATRPRPAKVAFHPIASISPYPKQTVLVDPALVSPPQGIKLTLVTLTENKVLAGPSGRLIPGPESARKLRESILSLLRYEESLMVVQGDIPVLKFDDAPFIPDRADFQGQPVYDGWHVVEISDGRASFRAMLPDKRYIHGDLSGYERSMKTRLDWLCDGKFVPGQPPGRMRGKPVRLQSPLPLPAGVSLVIDDGRVAVWDSGPTPGAKAAQTEVVYLRRIVSAYELAARESGYFPRKLDRKNGRLDNDVTFLAVFPGGEDEVPNFPLYDDRDFTANYGFDGVRQTQMQDLAERIAAAQKVHGELWPQGTITYGRATPPQPKR